MTRRAAWLCVLFALLLAACGPLASPFIAEVTSTPLASPRIAQAQASPTLAFTPTALPSDTPAPSATPRLILPTGTSTLELTDTPLPPLRLPTESFNALALAAFIGLPTYPGDSQPGLMYRLDYAPNLWAQTEGNYGAIVLAHRTIPYCTITPWAGRGLPMGWKVEHTFLPLGNLFFDKGTVTSPDGQLQFVTYTGGDKQIQTGFQVTFKDQPDACVAAAETVFTTLRSIVATPTVTPTLTPDVTP